MLSVTLMEAVSHFLPDCSDANTKFLPTCGGVNNVVFYVEQATGIDHVLRVYNNGNDTSKVEYEHSVLLQLNKMNLSFSLPETICSAESGKSFVTLSNGACACLFKLIPGSLPKLTNVQEIGRVSGELNQAMSRVNLSEMPQKCPNPPYYDLYKVHHAVTKELFHEKMLFADFDDYRASADFVLEEIRSTEERIAAYQTASPALPIQLIHGDLHYDNVLCDNGKVTGKSVACCSKIQQTSRSHHPACHAIH
jgi:homoserine kinase type II